MEFISINRAGGVGNMDYLKPPRNYILLIFCIDEYKTYIRKAHFIPRAGLRVGMISKNLNQYDRLVSSNPSQGLYTRLGLYIYSSYVAS